MERTPSHSRPSPIYETGTIAILTREDLHSEFKAFYSTLHADISSLLRPLKEEICHELRSYGSNLHKENMLGVDCGVVDPTAGVAGDSSKVSQDLGRMMSDDMKGLRDSSVIDSDLLHRNQTDEYGMCAASRETNDVGECAELVRATCTGSMKRAGSHTMPPLPPAEEASPRRHAATSTHESLFTEPIPEVNAKDVWIHDVGLAKSPDSSVRLEDGFALPGAVSTDYNAWSTIVPAPDETDVARPARPSQLSIQKTMSGISGRSGDVPLYGRRAVERRCSGLSAKTAKTTRTPKGTLATHSRRKRSDTTNRTGSTKQPPADLQRMRSGLGKTLRQRSLRIVSHIYFDYAITLFILMNGVLVGAQTDWMARNLKEVPPVPFQVLEWIFGIVFTVELVVRLFAYRWSFFYKSGMGWNLFDLTIVMLQWIEILLELMAAGLGLDFSLLRILRLIRVIRLARALRLIGELRTIVSSIAGSMKSLFWTGVLLFMIVYVLGVGFTQVVLNKRIKIEKDGQGAPNDLVYFWGDLISATFSLFESITGGLDWDDAVRPLIDNVGPGWGLVFTLYITFTVLAMLNVVTGVFIDSVMKNASLENDNRIASHITHLFRSLDVDASGEISWEQFESQLDRKEMKEFFKSIDVDIANAQTLFELLDLDESGEVNANEFVDGCLRIWSPAKGTDIHMIRSDINRLARCFQDLDERFGERVLESLASPVPASHGALLAFPCTESVRSQ